MSLPFFPSVRTSAGQKELGEITQDLERALAVVEQVLQQAEKTFNAGSNGAKQGELIRSALGSIRNVKTTIQAQERPTPVQETAPALRL